MKKTTGCDRFHGGCSGGTIESDRSGVDFKQRSPPIPSFKNKELSEAYV
jgi:hypothetical protein